MMSVRRVLRSVGLPLLGAFLGTASAILATRALDPEPSAALPDASAPALRVASGELRGAEREVSNPHTAPRALELLRSSGQEVQQPIPEEIEHTEAEAQEALQREDEPWARTPADVEREPTSPQSESATAAIRDQLSTLADERGFELVESLCRTTHCRATLEWGTYADAQRDAQAVLLQPYPANCARKLRIPEPGPDASGPYRAHIVLTCEGEPQVN